MKLAANFTLFIPKIEGITWGSVAALVTKVALRIRCVEACIISLWDTNTMVRPAAAIASSTNHHYGSITTIQVTPKGQVIPASNVAVTAVHLTEALSGSVGATMVTYRTTSTSALLFQVVLYLKLPKLVIKLLKVLPPVQLLVTSSPVLELSSLWDTLI